MLPMVSMMVSGKVGVLTANSDTLSPAHFAALGVNIDDYVIKGLQHGEMFTNFTVQNWDHVDMDVCRMELMEAAREITTEHPELRALVLECSNMPPYIDDIRKAANIPVFDLVMLTEMIVSAAG